MPTKAISRERCGGFGVRRWRGLVRVTCARCGISPAMSRFAARRLARHLRGPLGRFAVNAAQAERLQLADLLVAAAAR